MAISPSRLFTMLATIVLSAFVVAACTDSDFSGNNAKKGAQDDEDADDSDAGDADDGGLDADGDLLDGSDAGSDADDDILIGDDTVDCDSNPLQNADESFTFAKMDEIRSFVNAHCDVGIPTAWATQGAVRADPATKDKVCRLKGFERADSSVDDDWSSPGDNHMAWWDEASKSFVLKDNSNGNNYWLASLVCKGRVHDKCSEEQNKEKCEYN